VRVFLPERLDSTELRSALEQRVASLGSGTGAAELAGLRVEFRALPPEDYATSWRKNWKPFRVGRLCVVLPGSDRRLRAGDVALRLEPGGAFGSGRHPTTRECLRAIQERLHPGARVLDAGSGSGILAVSAVLFGAVRAFGFDVDPNAKPYADALALENEVQARCEFRTAGFEVLDGPRGAFDALVANIYADVLIEHVARLRAALEPGGWFAFSGCTLQHAPATRAAIEHSGLVLQEVRVRGRWHTFAGIR
jgi:ribosomal protein L11 methyltransferase